MEAWRMKNRPPACRFLMQSGAFLWGRRAGALNAGISEPRQTVPDDSAVAPRQVNDRSAHD